MNASIGLADRYRATFLLTLQGTSLSYESSSTHMYICILRRITHSQLSQLKTYLTQDTLESEYLAVGNA